MTGDGKLRMKPFLTDSSLAFLVLFQVVIWHAALI